VTAVLMFVSAPGVLFVSAPGVVSERLLAVVDVRRVRAVRLRDDPLDDRRAALPDAPQVVVEEHLVVLRPHGLRPLREVETLGDAHPLERLDEVRGVLPALPPALLDAELDPVDGLPGVPV